MTPHVTTPAADRLEIDLLDPALYQDIDGMHRAFTWMRDEEPLYHDARNDIWAVTRHADVTEVERRSRDFVSGLGYRSFPSPGEDNMISLDDPRHAEQRRLISRRFSPASVERLGPLVQAIIDDLVDPHLASGHMEVVSAIAAPLPARVTCHMLGFPQDHWPDVKSWSERIMRYEATATDPVAQEDFFSAVAEFRELLRETTRDRLANPQDDLVSVWLSSDVGGCPLTERTLVNETGLVISGGAETTRTVIARGLAAFCEHPEQWRSLVDRPDQVATAVEELIRWVTPINNFFRTAARDTTIGTQEVKGGARLALMYPSANRDGDVFRDPFTFDISRNPNPHVAFGFGTHFCLGASVARLTLQLLFRKLARCMSEVHVGTPADIEPNVIVSAVKSFEMEFDSNC